MMWTWVCWTCNSSVVNVASSSRFAIPSSALFSMHHSHIVVVSFERFPFFATQMFLLDQPYRFVRASKPFNHWLP